MRAWMLLLLAACHAAPPTPGDAVETDEPLGPHLPSDTGFLAGCAEVGHHPPGTGDVDARPPLLVGEVGSFRCLDVPPVCVDLHLRWLAADGSVVREDRLGPTTPLNGWFERLVTAPDALWVQAWCAPTAIPGVWRVGPETFPVVASQDLDSDGDGLRDVLEVQLGTDRSDPDSDDDGAGDFEEVQASTDPTDPGSRPEVCRGGVDEDRDGLLDCEDDDCASGPACEESACDGGVDDDLDGLIDCADDDCWGLAACDAGLTLVVRSARGHADVSARQRLAVVGGVLAITFDGTATFTLADVVGSVTRRAPAGSVVSQCSFTLDRAGWVLRQTRRSGTASTVLSEGVATRTLGTPTLTTVPGAPGCAPDVLDAALPLAATTSSSGAGWSAYVQPPLQGDYAVLHHLGIARALRRPWLGGAGGWTTTIGYGGYGSSSALPRTTSFTRKGTWPALSGTWTR